MDASLHTTLLFSTDAVKQRNKHVKHLASCFSPQVVLVVSQTHRHQRVGAQLHKTLVKLLGHKVKSVEKQTHGVAVVE